MAKLNWMQTFAIDGRHAKIIDYVDDGTGTTFCAAVPLPLTLDDVIDDYADSYRINTGDFEVTCRGFLYDEDGNEIERSDFTI